ncbi:MAG TPA: hypothetical protein VKB12_13000 [Pyrinomonadaceae bacterium]|nr:hypothetical protein [Pyrinomonadaceae bacterium]
MSIIGNLITELIERNDVVIKGAITVGLADGAVKLSADLRTEVQDRNNHNKPVARMLIPMSARAVVDEMVIPVRIPRR